MMEDIPDENNLEQYQVQYKPGPSDRTKQLEPLHIKLAPVSDTDIVLIIRYNNGDEAAFNQLYLRYHAKLYTYLLRMTKGNKDLANDLFEITWEKVIRFQADIAARAEAGTLNFLAFLYKIATNTWLDHIKSPKSKEESLDSLLDDDTRSDEAGTKKVKPAFELDYLSVPSQERPEEQVEQQETAHRINKILDQLKPEHRVILKWRFIDGLKTKEIWQQRLAELKYEGVRSRLQTAIEKFKELYEQEVKNDGEKDSSKEDI